MRYAVLLAALILVAPSSTPAQKPPASPGPEEELKRMTQELLDAVAPGNKAVWDRYLAPECIYAAEDGRTLTKAQLLEELSPLPSGYKRSIRVANPQVRVHGDTAVITYDAMEDLEIHGQALATRFHTTDTWLRRDGRWRMIASQVSVIPSEPKAVAVDPRILDAYVGTYTLAPGVEYKVRREGNRLIGQRTGRPRRSSSPGMSGPSSAKEAAERRSSSAAPAARSSASSTGATTTIWCGAVPPKLLIAILKYSIHRSSDSSDPS